MESSNWIALSSFVILLLAFYWNVLSRPEDPGHLRPYRSNVSYSVSRKKMESVDQSFAKSLASYGKPLVLQNSIGETFPRITIASLTAQLEPEYEIKSFFEHSHHMFGPYYDASRPMHQLPLVRSQSPYKTEVGLKVKDIDSLFKQKGPPYFSLSINPEELGIAAFNITEMISLYPQKSSVNLWLGMKDGTTPCHYDGYHNMYVQLAGQKKFIMFSPNRMSSMKVYPFLHPSYGQCNVSIEKDLVGSERDWIEVTLSPGELLYIPPFWIHEVVGMTPSVAFNVWTGIEDENIFQEILSHPIPFVERPYDSTLDNSPLDFKPRYPLQLQELHMISTRLIFGVFLVQEVLHRADIKNLVPSSIKDAYSRYKFLISTGKLRGIPEETEKAISRTADQWMPKPPVLGAAVWGMSIADKKMGNALTAYSMEISALFKKLDSKTVSLWGANFIEAVALQAGSVEKASWLIDFLGRRAEKEEARREEKKKLHRQESSA